MMSIHSSWSKFDPRVDWISSIALSKVIVCVAYWLSRQRGSLLIILGVRRNEQLGMVSGRTVSGWTGMVGYRWQAHASKTMGGTTVRTQ